MKHKALTKLFILSLALGYFTQTQKVYAQSGNFSSSSEPSFSSSSSESPSQAEIYENSQRVKSTIRIEKPNMNIPVETDNTRVERPVSGQIDQK